jgi:hypothetical protein
MKDDCIKHLGNKFGHQSLERRGGQNSKVKELYFGDSARNAIGMFTQNVAHSWLVVEQVLTFDRVKNREKSRSNIPAIRRCPSAWTLHFSAVDH